MIKRPLTVTIIAWFLIVISLFGLISCLLSINDSTALEMMSRSLIPISFQYMMMGIDIFFSIICGIGFLKRQSWSRFLYVILHVIQFPIVILTTPLRAIYIPSLIIFLIICILLFLPNSNKYFKTESLGDLTNAK